MTICWCPDCVGSRTMGRDCETCKGSRYVHRNSWGRITHPASPEDFVRQERERTDSYRSSQGRVMRIRTGPPR